MGQARPRAQDDDFEIEVRQVYEMSDFPEDVQEAAGELSQAPPEQTDPPGSRVAATHAAIDAVWRIESRQGDRRPSRAWCATSASPRTSRRTRSSRRWRSGRETGVPDNPGAWLTATAKHRAIDLLRRRSTLERKHEELARELEVAASSPTSTPRSTTRSATTC